ncbi:SDR family oxidoreductase [Novosphingobium profundi]|uniref:SDR family oxidoreductase n=1 Tax=Novosphingobium profundi TaxID=1774954 RepID=UPI001BDB0693|nr:SDR family oxidoreductase [Novosphingobium profundi]MBT0666935.1 SDR family oxidoreductase [Novosphingobium profundi]
MTTSRKSVLITGGAKRIGSVIAKAFADEGWHVVIHYGKSRDQAENLKQRLPSAEIISCDLNDTAAANAMIHELAQRLDDWSALVNCAAVFDLDTAQAMSSTIFDTAMRVNAATPASIAQAYFRHARARGGRSLIHVTDQKLANPNPDFFSYTMSKHALAATIPMLSMARSNDQDRVFGIAPGAILASHDQREEETEVSHRMNLLHRKTPPDEIARTALFMAKGWLASGQTVFVDSGQHLVPQPRDVLFLARA